MDFAGGELSRLFPRKRGAEGLTLPAKNHNQCRTMSEYPAIPEQP